MRERREILQREFEDRGYRVLPEQELPEDAESYAKVVQDGLKSANLSVHLIGARYGSIPEGADKSGVELQTDLALAQLEPPLRSILWSPPDIAVANLAEDRQRAFIERLEQAAFEPQRAEFMRSSIEQLKSLVIERLRPSRPATSAVGPPKDEGQSLYLVCDPVDRADAKPLQTALANLGFVVVRPSLEGTTEELMDENKAYLVGCDVVVVVWGRSREAWVRSKLREAQQAPGWGREREFRGRFVVIAPPDSDAKRDFDAPPGVVVLQGSGYLEQLGQLLQ
jgi:hypothetical protein